MIDWRQRHLDRAKKEMRELLMPGANIDEAAAAIRQKRVPEGSEWFWAIGVVGPKGSAVEPDTRIKE